MVQVTGTFLFLSVAVILGFYLGGTKIPLPGPCKGFYIEDADEGWPYPYSELTGRFKPLDVLHEASHLFTGKILTAETVAVDLDGSLLIADRTGKMYKAMKTSEEGPADWSLLPEPIVDLGAGAPLGLHVDPTGTIWVCDAIKGLLKVDRTVPGEPRVYLVATEVNSGPPEERGLRPTHVDDVDVASDGTVYFTSSTEIIPDPEHIVAAGWATLFRGVRSGRLLAYSPETDTTRILAGAMWFPNGVTLSHDGDFLLVSDTLRYAILRYWLKGPKAGTLEVLIDELPGIPDNISRSKDGNYWVALMSPGVPLAKYTQPKAVRAALAWLSSVITPPLTKVGLVLKISGEGEVLQVLRDPLGQAAAAVSSVTEHEGRLYLGGLHDHVTVFDLAKLEAVS